MKNKVLITRILSVALALGLWQIAAVALGQQLLLVSPIKVFVRLSSLCFEAGFWQSIWFSLGKIALGFFLAVVIASLLGVLSYRFRLIEILLWPYVALTKSVPVASFIIISLVWLSAKNLSIFISFLMVFPVVYYNILQGMGATDAKKLQMAKLFEIPWSKRLFYIYLPQIKPFVISACSVALGMAWKAGVAAEVIGIPDGSIGERLYEAKVYLNTADLFAWTIVIVVVSLLFEKIVLFGIKRGFALMERR